MHNILCAACNLIRFHKASLHQANLKWEDNNCSGLKHSTVSFFFEKLWWYIWILAFCGEENMLVDNVPCWVTRRCSPKLFAFSIARCFDLSRKIVFKPAPLISSAMWTTLTKCSLNYERKLQNLMYYLYPTGISNGKSKGFPQSIWLLQRPFARWQPSVFV